MTRWPTKSLAEMCERITDGSHRTPAFVETGYPFVTVAHVNDEGKIDFSACKKISTADFEELKKNDCRPLLGDVLFSKDGTVGKVAVIDFDKDFAALSSLAILRPRPDLLNQSFLAYALKSAPVLSQAINRKSGAAIRRIVLRDLCQLSLPLPPLPEQERIVRRLDEANELRRLRAQADSRTADLIPALFHAMFGDPTRLQKMPWPFKPLGEFAAVSYGLADKLDASTKPESGTRILTISNVLLNGSIDTKVEKYSVTDQAQRAKARLQQFDLLFNWRNGSEEHVGKTAIWEEQIHGEILHVSFLLKIRTDRSQAHPYFVWALLNRLRATGYFLQNARMQINRKFNASELSALKLPLPPLTLQAEFAKQVTETHELEAKQTASRERLNALFQSLLHRAFNGDL